MVNGVPAAGAASMLIGSMSTGEFMRTFSCTGVPVSNRAAVNHPVQGIIVVCVSCNPYVGAAFVIGVSFDGALLLPPEDVRIASGSPLF